MVLDLTIKEKVELLFLLEKRLDELNKHHEYYKFLTDQELDEEQVIGKSSEDKIVYTKRKCLDRIVSNMNTCKAVLEKINTE